MRGWEWLLTARWVLAVGMPALLAWALVLRAQLRRQTAQRWQERRLREELESYAEVDPSLGGGAADRTEALRALSKRVCRVVAEKSAFSRVGLMLRDAEEQLVCMGSVGVDDLTVKALDAWGRRVVEEERGLATPDPALGPSGVRAGSRSFPIALGEWGRFDPEVDDWAGAGRRERRRWRRALVAPVRAGNGHLQGAVVVCADGPRGADRQRLADGLERAMGPIETLAARLSCRLENDTLAERLRQAEKLAGLGQIAGGVAHALEKPLTAVLGFADLLAETAGEPRVRQDAELIRTEANRMRETVARLHRFSRPVVVADERVELPALVRELAAECGEALAQRGVRLEVQAPAQLAAISGSRDRLRHLLEHLLNNAAQSIAEAQRRAAVTPRPTRDAEPEEPHTIRMTLTADAELVRLIVSDTGKGFAEPARAFDPFYTTRGSGAGAEPGAGMGLSVSFTIVREHGGEISAANLQGRGAAVVVELPLRRAAEKGAVRKPEPIRLVS